VTNLRRAAPPEVLAPVGGRPQLAAAIENGADAVYFGLTAFNARARAANFLPEELIEIMAELHERGVQGFVTFNTLIFDEELAAAERYVRLFDDARVDAVIVQDLGVAAWMRELAPDLPLHGSTQMTVTSGESAELVARLGLERVVLGRELSVREIRAVTASTDLEVEVFVHGALCVSYSGQCFSSEAWGGRSANRGQCAQACRLPYDLVVDGREHPNDQRYVLSPQDLMGASQVPALIDGGVACLKIEGRLKGPEYVALTTSTYRRLVDAAWAGAPEQLDAEELRDLQQVFSRGLTPGFLEGPKHQRLVRGRFPKHRGLKVGTVLHVQGRRVEIQLDGPLRLGDGVVFDAGRPQEDETGGTVHTLLQRRRPIDSADAGVVELKLGPKTRTDRVQPGDLVWKTRDPQLVERLGSTWSGLHRRAPIQATVAGAEGTPLTLTLTDERGRAATATTEQALAVASKRALDEGSLTESLGRLGATSFALAGVDASGLAPGLFLPVSALNRVRRAAADALLDQRRALRVRDALPPAPSSPARVTLTYDRRPPLEPLPSEPTLTVLCRSLEQVEAACDIDVPEIAVDFLEVKGLGDAVRRVQAAGKRAIAVSPRVLKPAEENLRRFLLKLDADAILVRSLGLLHSLLGEASVPLHGDFSLNAANRRTVRLLLDAGLSRLSPGHDLNAAQAAALAEPDTAGRLELIAHHHLPIFHTEHCVFARFLSDGDSKKDCGTPCERHALHLRGRDGQLHRVEADMGCRNTVFNAEAQSGLRDLPRFLDAGLLRFRVELVDHRPEEVAPLLDLYRAALAGAPSAESWTALRDSRFGATSGSLAILQAPRPDEMKRPGWMRDR